MSPPRSRPVSPSSHSPSLENLPTISRPSPRGPAFHLFANASLLFRAILPLFPIFLPVSYFLSSECYFPSNIILAFILSFTSSSNLSSISHPSFVHLSSSIIFFHSHPSLVHSTSFFFLFLKIVHSLRYHWLQYTSWLHPPSLTASSKQFSPVTSPVSSWLIAS